MGTTRDDGSQQSMWVATADLPQGGGHPFYERLNQILNAAGFDAFVEKLCAPFYARMGRPSLAPGRYFRLLLVGYFEGLDSERAIAWRAADSLSLRSFLRLAPPALPPDHSAISRTRRLLSLEAHQAVFTWVLQQLAEAGLLRGKTVGIDATTLEANAALRSIVRRDTGEDYTAFLTRLAEASGIATPTRADLARFDRSRKKKTSNAEWTHPHDPDARVTKMKDGRTHLAHKAEHAVDLDSGAVVGVTVQAADTGDTTSMVETLLVAAEQVEAAQPDGPGIEEVVGDKGYHSNETLTDLKAIGLRSYISEPDRGWPAERRLRDRRRPLGRVAGAGGPRDPRRALPASAGNDGSPVHSHPGAHADRGDRRLKRRRLGRFAVFDAGFTSGNTAAVTATGRSCTSARRIGCRITPSRWVGRSPRTNNKSSNGDITQVASAPARVGEAVARQLPGVVGGAMGRVAARLCGEGRGRCPAPASACGWRHSSGRSGGRPSWRCRGSVPRKAGVVWRCPIQNEG